MLALTTQARPHLNWRDSPRLGTQLSDLDYGHIPVGLRIADEANIVVALDDPDTGVPFTSTVRSAAGLTNDGDLQPLLFVDAGPVGHIEWSMVPNTEGTVGAAMDRCAQHVAAAIILACQDAGTPVSATVLSHDGTQLNARHSTAE